MDLMDCSGLTGDGAAFLFSVLLAIGFYAVFFIDMFVSFVFDTIAEQHTHV